MRRVTKEEAEWAIFNRFTSAYQTHYHTILQSPSYRDKPDFSVIDVESSSLIGVEVTGVYQDAREAEINYLIDYEWGSITGSFDDLVHNVNLSLGKKALKAEKYEWDHPLVLAIWLGSILFSTFSDVPFLVPKLTIPKNRYSMITLVLEDDITQAPSLYVLQEHPEWHHMSKV